MATQGKSTFIKKEKVERYKKAWLNCLPSKLSDLFYYESSEQGQERVEAYVLHLSEDDFHKLKEDFSPQPDGAERSSDPYKTFIQIEMACKEEKFAPIITFVNNDNNLSFKWTLKKQSDDGGGVGLTEISETIAELFCKKWQELTDIEVGHAFSGPTFERLNTQDQPQISYQGTEKIRRVNAYVFPQHDTEKILNYLCSFEHAPSEGQELQLLLGAGLTVRIEHPFNFRPIIHLPRHGKPADNDPAGEYFERAKPCPPYCKD